MHSLNNKYQYQKFFFLLISKAIVLKAPKVYTKYTRPKKRRDRQKTNIFASLTTQPIYENQYQKFMKVVLPCYAKFPQEEENKENHLAIPKGLQDPLKRYNKHILYFHICPSPLLTPTPVPSILS